MQRIPTILGKPSGRVNVRLRGKSAPIVLPQPVAGVRHRFAQHLQGVGIPAGAALHLVASKAPRLPVNRPQARRNILIYTSCIVGSCACPGRDASIAHIFALPDLTHAAMPLTTSQGSDNLQPWEGCCLPEEAKLLR